MKFFKVFCLVVAMVAVALNAHAAEKIVEFSEPSFKQKGEFVEIKIHLEKEKTLCVFAGDSPNDVPMFEFFPNSVGVANIKDFIDRLSTKPAFITSSRGGAGFAELAIMLINAQRKID